MHILVACGTQRNQGSALSHLQTGCDVVDDGPQGSTLVRMLGIATYTFARLLVKAVRTIQDPAASMAALVESDS